MKYRVMVSSCWLALALGAAVAAEAQNSAEPLDLQQSYSGVVNVDVDHIATYNTYLNGPGISNSYAISAGAFSFNDPFLKSSANPPINTYFLGVSNDQPADTDSFSAAAVAESPHLVLALSSAYAAGLVSGGEDFATIFPDYSETSLIDDLELIDTASLDPADAGYDAQQTAKNNAYSELFSFGATVNNRGGTTPAFGGPLTLLSFSNAVPIGSGIASVTALASDVPEPASWAMMVAGFGMIGAGLRARRTGRSPSHA